MDLISKSKFLSLVLRHEPQRIGLALDANGWANVNELLSKANLDFSTLEQIVLTNDKKRYAFNEDKTKIRASQGHSIQTIDLQLEPKTPPDFLYHGTARWQLSSILKHGLLKCNRQYVHLSLDIETARKVGQRHGIPIILVINCKSMILNNHKFFLSDNNVWLTEHVPPKYLRTL